MPELPEVETIRRGLLGTIQGARIEAIEARLPRVIVADPGVSIERAIGRTIEEIERRAKWLLLDLSGGLTLTFHLKLSGQLAVDRGGKRLFVGGHPVPAYDALLPHKSTQVTFALDGGRLLHFTDIRQFGRVYVSFADEARRVLATKKLGPEPLEADYTRAAFEERLRRFRKGPIKPVLLDQSFVAGVGNIYADEALHAAHIHPERPAGSLGPDERARLHAAIREVLRIAVEEGVAEVVNGVATPEAERRKFQRVHGRQGRACHGCGVPIERIVVRGRSTDFCPSCQPATGSAVE